MAATLIGVVYSTISSAIRRTIIPDDDSHLTGWVANNLPPGMALATVPIAKLPNGTNMAGLLAAIRAAGGPTILPPIRSVIIDQIGNVVDVLMADPAHYTPALGMQIVASDTAVIGWTYLGGLFVAPVASSVRTL